MKNARITKSIGSLILCGVIMASLAGCGKNSVNTGDVQNETAETTESISNATTEDVSPETSDNDIIPDKQSENTVFDIGATVTFGRYEQDNDLSNGAEPIKWQIKDIKDGKALLVSKYVLDEIQYNNYAGIHGDKSLESLPWAESDVFKWLHNDFASQAFTNDELQIIAEATDYSSEESETIGYIFLLSYEEVTKYFNLDTVTVPNVYTNGEYDCSYSHELLCKPTPYAVENGVDIKELNQEEIDYMTRDGLNCDSYTLGDSYAGYWLRSSLSWDAWFTAQGHALWVEENGVIELGKAGLDNVKTKNHGVRPCVWVDLDDSEEYLIIANDMEESWFTETEEEQPEDNTEDESEDKMNNEDESGWEVKDNTLYIFGNFEMKDWNPDSRGTYAPWYYDGNFTKVVIEEGIENIGAYAFYQCEHLVEIEIPDSVTSIGRNAFAECNSLENIYIPDSVKSIGYRMFKNCKNLISVRLPNEAEIASGLFEGCISLTSVNLPENIDTIGGYMFKECESLTSINIPDNVTCIEDFAFAHCTSLTSIEIPDSVTKIGEYAFVGCPAIE